MINVGLVGFGLSGRYLQAPFFMVHNAFNLKAIITSQEISNELFPNVAKLESIDNLLNDPRIDLISICSPNATHYQYAKKALLSRKHVLIEKPMTTTVTEAEELLALSKANGKILYTFQNRRFDSDFLTICKILQSKILGEILSFEASYERFKPALNPKQWKEEASPGSGILYDLGAHLIDQVICLFGIPLNYSGNVFTERANSIIDDAFNLQLDYSNLKVTLKSSLMAKELGPRYKIQGTNGSFIKYGIDPQEDQLKLGIWPKNPQFGKESEEFRGVIRSKLNGFESVSQVTSETGNWMELFNNLALAIKGEADSYIKPAEIIEQLRIIEKIKKI